MSEPSVMQRFFGGLLMAIGGLIVLTCGLCSAGFLWNYLLAPASGHFSNVVGLVSMTLVAIVVVAIFGGPPLAIGGALFWWGRNLQKGRRED